MNAKLSFFIVLKIIIKKEKQSQSEGGGEGGVGETNKKNRIMRNRKNLNHPLLLRASEGARESKADWRRPRRYSSFGGVGLLLLLLLRSRKIIISANLVNIIKMKKKVYFPFNTKVTKKEVMHIRNELCLLYPPIVSPNNIEAS